MTRMNTQSGELTLDIFCKRLRKMKNKTKKIVIRDRALLRDSKLIARKMMLLGFFGVICVTTSCTIGGSVNPNGYSLNCQGRGCDKYTEYAASIINETKLKEDDVIKSPFHTNQRNRDNRKGLLETWFSPSTPNEQGGE